MIYAYIVFLILLIGSEYIDYLKSKHLFLKGLTSLTFVVVAFIQYNNMHINSNLSYAKWIMIALVFCMLGDVLLSILHKEENPKFFIAGVAFFMLAHISFYVAFSFIAKISFWDILLVGILIIPMQIMTKCSIFDFRKLEKVCMIYTICLGLLLAKGITIFVQNQISTQTILIFIAAILFVISDVILVFHFFLKRKIKSLAFFNLLTYYSSTMLLALTISA